MTVKDLCFFFILFYSFYVSISLNKRALQDLQTHCWNAFSPPLGPFHTS